jgi:hypothetical protein
LGYSLIIAVLDGREPDFILPVDGLVRHHSRDTDPSAVFLLPTPPIAIME